MKITSGILFALSIQSISVYADSVNTQRTPFFTSKHKQSSHLSYLPPQILPQREESKSTPKHEEKTEEKELKHRFQVGPDYTWVSLKPNKHTTFTGDLWGVEALYEYRPAHFFYGAGRLSWKEGKTTNHTGSRSLFYMDVQERLGYTFACDSGNTQVSLFSGFGYRYLGHEFDPKEGSKVHFRYNEFYFPVGWVSNFCLSSWFSFGLDLTWMPQIFPTVGIVPLKGARWDLACSLANFSVELPLYFTFTKSKRFSLILKPFYEYWKDGHSTAKASNGSSLGIPSNTYDFWGVNLNLAYSF